jgi:hypothetical protein
LHKPVSDGVAHYVEPAAEGVRHARRLFELFGGVRIDVRERIQAPLINILLRSETKRCGCEDRFGTVGHLQGLEIAET